MKKGRRGAKMKDEERKSEKARKEKKKREKLEKNSKRKDHCIIESGNLLYGTTRRKYLIIWRKWRNKNQFLQIIDPNSLKNR